jgi:hypothetical protein
MAELSAEGRARSTDCAVCGYPKHRHSGGFPNICPIVATYRPKPEPTAALDGGPFMIDERDDDMLIAERHWQYGWRCIARRPKLMTNDEWRPEAERIVRALKPQSAGTSGEGER